MIIPKPITCLFGILHLAISTAQGATLPPGFAETKIATGLNPTTMTFAPDGRLFLCEKQGLLRVIDEGEMLPGPFLDLTGQVDSWNERGLLSVCFDPEFATNGWLYLYYTHNRKPEDKSHRSSNNRVSRFTAKGNVVVPGSEKVIFEIDHLSKIGWHNGGGLAFGQDGKLYLSTGENAQGPNAQDPGNLLGKLLRINKDGSIPIDNPHYRDFKDRNRAIVALGLRNPYTIASQPETGILFLSEVGANYEQIEKYDSSAPPVAKNFGWPDIDGKVHGKNSPPGYQDPVYPYDHGKDQGLALCGGDFYLPGQPGPEAFPVGYRGKYFFSDYGGWIKMIDPDKPELRLDFASGINRAIDVATAPDGALWYIERAGIQGGSDEANTASKDGSLWRVTWTGEKSTTAAGTPSPVRPVKLAAGLKLASSPEKGLPPTLTETGIFSEMATLKPIASALPYTLNSTVWADGAEMKRWVILPEGEGVKILPSGEFKWPAGTVLVQHFDLVIDEKTSLRRKLETRILVLDQTGAFGYGASYRWRARGQEADLVSPDGEEEVISIKSQSGTLRQQTWPYPSSGLCYLCHTPNAGFVLGPKLHQLDRDQLHQWSTQKVFHQPLSEQEIKEAPQTCRTDDESAPLTTRVRSYLDVNCAACHRPGGTGAGWDARFTTPLDEQGIIDGIVRNNLGIEEGKLIAPGDLAKSFLHRRMKAIGAPEQMPPVTRSVPDEKTLDVIAKWIKSIKETE